MSPGDRFASSPFRTFVLAPALSLAAGAVASHGRLRPIGLPLLAAGYLLYRYAGLHRHRSGNTGDGFASTPEQLVTSGPYAFTRNPMYLGHLVFLTGLVLATRSPIALAAAVSQWRRLDARARADEDRLEELFGPGYAVYRARVARWLPAPRAGGRSFSGPGEGTDERLGAARDEGRALRQPGRAGG